MLTNACRECFTFGVHIIYNYHHTLHKIDMHNLYIYHLNAHVVIIMIAWRHIVQETVADKMILQAKSDPATTVNNESNIN